MFVLEEGVGTCKQDNKINFDQLSIEGKFHTIKVIITLKVNTAPTKLAS